MNNKIALVTGGTSGIGKEIVTELISKGCKIITCYRNIKQAKKHISFKNSCVYPETVAKFYCFYNKHMIKFFT
ncbi:MAG: SDR family NAD(P)-dependent oxidoreductase [Bacilli bacterium]|nr:SDR family NAD(P)-dependent oxidoreductase [Bacilli bacterium]